MYDAKHMSDNLTEEKETFRVEWFTRYYVAPQISIRFVLKVKLLNALVIANCQEWIITPNGPVDYVHVIELKEVQL